MSLAHLSARMVIAVIVLIGSAAAYAQPTRIGIDGI